MEHVSDFRCLYKCHNPLDTGLCNENGMILFYSFGFNSNSVHQKLQFKHINFGNDCLTVHAVLDLLANRY